MAQARRDFPAPHSNSQAQRADTIDPTISIIAPAEGLSTVDRATVLADAPDDEANAKVEFYVDDALRSAAIAPPYQTALDLSGRLGEPVVIRAVAYDYALREASESREVTPVGGNTPGSASFHTTTLTIPTYPHVDHLTTVYTRTYNMTYRAMDWDFYYRSNQVPVARDYQLLVVENDYLRVTLLPELGGRVYQMVFKPTGHNELYQSPVIKPNHWGALEQNWWLAVGGMEWCLPVYEHGYEWGEPSLWSVVTSTEASL